MRTKESVPLSNAVHAPEIPKQAPHTRTASCCASVTIENIAAPYKQLSRCLSLSVIVITLTSAQHTIKHTIALPVRFEMPCNRGKGCPLRRLTQIPTSNLHSGPDLRSVESATAQLITMLTQTECHREMTREEEKSPFCLRSQDRPRRIISPTGQVSPWFATPVAGGLKQRCGLGLRISRCAEDSRSWRQSRNILQTDHSCYRSSQLYQPHQAVTSQIVSSKIRRISGDTTLT